LSLLLILLVALMGAAAMPFSAMSAAAANQQTRLSQPQSGVYIVVMGDDPVIAYKGDVPGLQATKPANGRKLDPNSVQAKQYSAYLKRNHDNILQAVGAAASAKRYSYTVALNGFAAKLSPNQVAQIAKQPGVRAVLVDQRRYAQTDSSPDFLGLTGSNGPWAKGYKGENVVVGVIDTGIWPEHPSFADNGSYGPPPITLENTADNPSCNFGNLAHNPNDAAFTCNNKLIGARFFLNTYRDVVGFDADEFASARDDNGHGTHTSSTAAGNSGVHASIYGIPRGTISGIAPRARVVAYKALGKLGGFSSDLAAAIDQAVADGVDVINYSIGGGASLTGADDLAFLGAADAGVFVATSAGNEGPGAATIGGPASVPWVTSVGASTQKRFFEGKVKLGNGKTYTGASITAGTGTLPLVDAAAAGSEVCIVGSLNPTLVSGKIVLCKRGVNGRAEKSQAVFAAGGAGMILYNENDVDNLFSDTHWVPSIHIDLTPGLAIKNYIAHTAHPTARLSAGKVGKWSDAPSMTIFSSRGPNPVAEDIIKPDVTAPGLQILAGNTPLTNEGVPGELFQAIAGTSMSSPHVAGLFALLKQVNPDWSAAIAKSALMTTAYQDVLDNDRESQAGPFAMGAGHVDPSRVGKGSPFQPGLAYDVGFNEYLGFLCEAAPEVFVDATSTCNALAAAGIPTQARNLNLPSIAVSRLPGTETIVRTVTSVAKESGAREYKVSVKAPRGYKVTVTPSTIRLRSGESASYQVTFLNRNAPIGEWRFGSLTWEDKSGNYDVYSPIALRAAKFFAPAELTGSGAAGSLSFPVKFGYTGAYAAAAHGFVPATITPDNVLQDPDQTFDPNDGFSDLHTFNLSGAALLRVALPPSSTEADADLDIYVFNPSGELVASSTQGGTDELVDIVLPANGTWSVFVHGWSTPGGDSNYNLESWVISATPGGNLNIVSAPTSATNGQVGTVNVNWSGLSAGTKYLGAVSHNEGSNILGLTLIKVEP
jgi:subtilisin family serine protease